LAERLLPDYGLTPDGVLPLTPKVTMVIDGLKPRFVDAEGRTLKDLPDDADEDLRELKQKKATLAREVAARLEMRMTTCERMSLQHFTEVYVMHGLARQLANGVLWSTYSPTGEPRERFTLDQMPVLDDDTRLGVVHPLELTAADRARWGKHFTRQPIEQLDRTVFSFEDASAFEGALNALVDRTANTGSLIGLENRRWSRGDPIGLGCYVDVARQAQGIDVRVSFEPGIYLGAPEQNPQQRIAETQVSIGAWSLQTAVLVSEIVRDVRSTLVDA